MAFTNWFKPDGALQDFSPEDLRREEHRLRIREEQAVARLQQIVTDKEEAFRTGAENRSLALRRILARKFAAAADEQERVERDLLRLGKDLVTVRAFQALPESPKRPKSLGETAADLQVSFEDDRVGEAAYRDSLYATLAIPTPEFDPVAEVFRVWRGLDNGEFADAAEARRALSGNGQAEEGKDAGRRGGKKAEGKG